jgi:hypothetical protein
LPGCKLVRRLAAGTSGNFWPAAFYGAGRISAGDRMIMPIAILLVVLVFPSWWLNPPCAGAAEAARPAASSPADLHIKFTALRPRTPQCLQRGRELVQTLRKSLEKYKDYKAAQAAGYTGYYTDTNLPMYHFASKWRAFKELMRFDPGGPTALLYKKTAAGYELIGVMYYAPGRYSEDQLDQRVPLCLARWHRQINVCLPPGGAEDSSDPRFGSDGTIVSADACKKSGGRWYPEVHGWMTEIYPFEHDPGQIWGYRPG